MGLPHTNKKVIYVDFKRREWTEREPNWISDGEPGPEDKLKLDIARRAADLMILEDLTLAEARERVLEPEQVTPS